MKKIITIKDVAKICGASVSTVSYALNGSHNGKVSPAKRDEIIRQAAAMGYHPNPAAKSLILKKHRRIGVLFSSMSNHSFSGLIENIQRGLAKHGYAGLCASWGATGESEPFRRTYQELTDSGIDGVIVAHSDFGALRTEIPAVIYGHSEAFGKYDSVTVSTSHIVRTAAMYLLALGHRRIAVMSHASESDRQARLEVMREVIPSYPDDYCAGMDDSVPGGISALRHLLRFPPADRPTALITSGDDSACGVYGEAVRQGIRIPEDLSVIGTNNLPESSFLNPPLTTFDYDRPAVANMLVELMMRRLDEPVAPIRNMVLTTNLLKRGSCMKRANEKQSKTK